MKSDFFLALEHEFVEGNVYYGLPLLLFVEYVAPMNQLLPLLGCILL